MVILGNKIKKRHIKAALVTFGSILSACVFFAISDIGPAPS